MKHTFLTLFTGTILFTGAMLSCEKELPGGDDNGSREAVVPITLSCELLEGEEPVKSSYSSSGADSDLRRITDMQYYLFKDGVLKGQKYFSSPSAFAVTLPDQDETYTLYILANAGQKTVSDSTTESDMASAVSVEYTDDNYVSTMKSKGFPMANKITGFNRNSGGQFHVKRLVHELRVILSDDAMTGYNKVTFKSIKVRQAAANVFPFAAQSKATKVLSTAVGDFETPSSGIAPGSQVTLYMLENMRGNLMSGNSDWKRKVPSNLSSTERTRATFIEITADAETATAVYEGNIYRAYLGKSPENFDVVRSEYFVLNNSFSDNLLNDEQWRKDIVDPDPKPVSLVPTNCYDLITIQNFPLTAKIESDVPLDQLTVSWTIPNFQDRASSSKSVASLSYSSSTGVITATTYSTAVYGGRWDEQPYYVYVPVTVKSKDGMINKTFNIKVQVSAFNVRWKYQRNSSVSVTDGTYLTVEGDSYTTQFMNSKDLSLKLACAGGYLSGKTYWQNSGIDGNSAIRSDAELYTSTIDDRIQLQSASTKQGVLSSAASRLQSTGRRLHHWTWFGTDDGVYHYPVEYWCMLLAKLYLYKGSTQVSIVNNTVTKGSWGSYLPILFSNDRMASVDNTASTVIYDCSHSKTVTNTDNGTTRTYDVLHPHGTNHTCMSINKSFLNMQPYGPGNYNCNTITPQIYANYYGEDGSAHLITFHNDYHTFRKGADTGRILRNDWGWSTINVSGTYDGVMAIGLVTKDYTTASDVTSLLNGDSGSENAFDYLTYNF